MTLNRLQDALSQNVTAVQPMDTSQCESSAVTPLDAVLVGDSSDTSSYSISTSTSTNPPDKQSGSVDHDVCNRGAPRDNIRSSVSHSSSVDGSSHVDSLPADATDNGETHDNCSGNAGTDDSIEIAATNQATAPAKDLGKNMSV